MKRLFTLLLFLGMANLVQAQLASGTIAPNFTGTDIDGNTWTLYDLLDEGKTVILDMSATWCGPCWQYHQAEVLKNIQNTYGPDGTDEFMVLKIEADPNTGLADLQGTTATSQGNWIDGTPYPIIDDASIGELYNVNYFPTIYSVCSNRILTEIGRADVAGHYAHRNTCVMAGGSNNVGIFFYDGLEGSQCDGNSFTPSISFQSLGDMNVTSATFELLVNGESLETKTYEGDLGLYDFTELAFDTEITIDQDLEIAVQVVDVNGMDDDDAAANSLDVNITLAPAIDKSVLNLRLVTDLYAAETYWEIVDGNGTAYYTGGNSGIFAQPAIIAEGTHQSSTEYNFEIALPSDGCYEFRIYDFYGDGICCGQTGDGSFTLSDGEGNTLFTGGQFTDRLFIPFELSGSPGVTTNAQIAAYDGFRGEFCGSNSFAPELLVQNIGSDEITSMVVDVAVNGNSVETINFEGSIDPDSYGTIAASTIDLDTDAEIVFTIQEVNGGPDAYTYKNTYTNNVTRSPIAETQVINIDIVTDNYGYELYWRVINEVGTVMADGGNEVVGNSGGGGNRIAAANNPGAYGNNATISETIELPATGCYTIQVWDDYGDGMCCNYGNGSFTATDINGGILIETGAFGREANRDMEVGMLVNSPDIEELEEMILAPNPTDEQLNVSLYLSEGVQMEMVVINSYGQIVRQLGAENYSAGRDQITINTSDLSPGIYFLRMRSENGLLSRKFTVVH